MAIEGVVGIEQGREAAEALVRSFNFLRP